MPDTGTRDVEAPSWSRYPVNVERWAVVIGISRYQHPELELKYARRDAEVLRDFLASPAFGLAIDRDHMLVLLDEEATASAIRKALRTFLKKGPRAEDVVIIYIACHGAPDLDRPENVYLLSYDTDPGDISGTAVDMSELDVALRSTRAERGVILADTCHAGAMARQPGRRGADDSRAVAAYLDQVSQARAGIALITAVGAGGTSREGERWGGGHGVFTHHVLEGLRGAADGAGGAKVDGMVTARELYAYVRERVLADTDQGQEPWLGPTQFDDRLPLAITGGASARDHHQLGLAIDLLARRLEDPRRFEEAAAELAEASRLAAAAGQPLPLAKAACGLAWLDAGQHARAAEALREALALDPDLIEARYHLALALAPGDAVEAARVLGELAARAPQHPLAAWGAALAVRIAAPPRRRRALLVGAARVDGLTLSGPERDVEALGAELAKLGFECTTLVGDDATAAGVMAALQRLAHDSAAADDALVYFAGHAASDGDGEGDALIANDYRRDGGGAGRVPLDEVHELLAHLPAAQRWLILETSALQQTTMRALSTSRYDLWIAASGDVPAREREVDGVRRGAFSAALTKAIASGRGRGGELERSVKRELRAAADGPPQVPVFVASSRASLQPRPAWWLDTLARDRGLRALPDDQLVETVGAARALGVACPQLLRTIGWELLSRSSFGLAEEALTEATRHDPADADASLGLAIVHFVRARRRVAIDELARLRAFAPEPWRPVLDEVGRAATAGTTSPFRALLVGIDDYAASGLPALQGALNDVGAMHAALVERCGVPREAVRVLRDGEASRAAILGALRELAAAPAGTRTFFYFGGYGSAYGGEAEHLTLVPHDGRSAAGFDLGLDELRAIAPAALITVCDVGWSFGEGDRTDATRRVAAPDPRPRPGVRMMAVSRPMPSPIGACLVTNQSLRYNFDTRTDPLELVAAARRGRPEEVRGVLTAALTEALWELGPEDVTVARWLQRATRFDARPVCLPDADSAELVLGVADDRLVDALLELRLQAVREALARFREWVGRPGGIEQGAYFHLGLAQVALGQHAQAIDALRAHRQDGRDERRSADVGHYLGRAHLATGDLEGAVSELRRAAASDPANVATRYYLGDAIRQLITRRSMIEAEQAFDSYLADGAPHGHEDTVRAQLAEWRHEVLEQRRAAAV